MSDIKKIRIGGVDYDLRSNGLTKVTYTELKEMRDNGGLAAGHLYRITDYTFTTVEKDTKSAGNVFDIIVLATAENQLSHIARAIQHEGDTYFDGNDLGAWELWYDLDNDTTKYEWADADNGKGIIYRMIDEKRNDCPYDFKNALFYNTKRTSTTISDKYYYTFSYVVSSKLYDGTVEMQVTNCYGNSISINKDNHKKSLSSNVFINRSFGQHCYSNTLGDNCWSNTFGKGCYNNKFGKGCYSNTFGDDCNSNIFGYLCYYNTFGDNCRSNIFGDLCQSNTFGKDCYSNTFGKGCYNNKFDVYCRKNKFGYDCYYNTFGSSCSSNIFGDLCQSNTFGGYCNNNKFGNNCNSITFGYNVSNRELNSEKTSITLNDEYSDDGSGKLVPIKHPDLSTQPSILPYKFMGQYVYEQLIPVKVGDRIVNCDFEVEYPMILSAGVFGVNSFKNVDIIATKSDALLLNTESELAGYINVKYTDASQLLPSNGYGYGYGDNNIESSALIDFGLSSDGTLYIYNPNTETLSLYKSGEITQDSIPQNLPTKNIILSEGVTSIGDSAFAYCRSLTSITLPESVTSIRSHAFSSCTNLTEINIPKSVTSIGDRAFFNCISIERVTINCANVGSWFGGRSSLKEIVLGESVTSIGYAAFSDCSSLTDITIPEGVTSIGEYAFSRCSSLTDITIPENSQLTSIGWGAFEDNPWYNNQPDGVMYLGKVLYKYKGTMTANTSIEVEEGTVSIGTNAFSNCSSLTSITLPESVTSIRSHAFSSCTNLTEINIPKSVTSIENDAFYNCSNIISINIPENSQLTGIEYSAFSRCSSLTAITIPEGVTSIGTHAFSDCSSLTTITCKAITPPSIYANTFNGVNKSILVYVPAESIDAYKVANVWKDFTNIQAI